MMPPSDSGSGLLLLGSGEMAGWAFTLKAHRSFPVPSAIARNLPSHDPIYTVPFATMGVAVTAMLAGTNHRSIRVGAVAGVSFVPPWNVRPGVRPNIGHVRWGRARCATAPAWCRA